MGNEKQEKKEEAKPQPTQAPQAPQARQIVIEFDAQQARIIFGQVSSNFELIGILESLLEAVRPKK